MRWWRWWWWGCLRGNNQNGKGTALGEMRRDRWLVKRVRWRMVSPRRSTMGSPGEQRPGESFSRESFESLPRSQISNVGATLIQSKRTCNFDSISVLETRKKLKISREISFFYLRIKLNEIYSRCFIIIFTQFSFFFTN